MALWLAAGALTLVVIVLLLRPLVRGPRSVAPRLDYDLAIYRDQLAELERDAARGTIAAAEAAAARTEIERRMLKAASVSEANAPRIAASPRLGLALVLALGVPFMAGAAYLLLGSPTLPSIAAGNDPPPADAADRKRLAELEAKLSANPTSLADRLALADHHFENRRFRSAAESYRLALALADGRAAIAALYGEALTRASGGVVIEPARRAFEQALARDPRESRARFFLGLAEAQSGKPRAALERWLRLEAEAPAGAAWISVLRREIARVAKEGEIDVAALRRELGLGEPRGPSEQEMEDAAQNLSPAERTAMIRGMVERLAARLRENPADLEGWKRLARSHAVLGDQAQAAEAWRRAHELAPDDAPLLADYAAALIRAQPQGQELTPDAVAVLRKLLARDPDNALALFYVGAAEAASGNKDTAAAHWRRLLDKLPADAPIRELIEKRLAALGVAGAK